MERGAGVLKRLAPEQLLAIDKFSVDDEYRHIVLDRDKCKSCHGKPCIYACPAGLYNLKDGEVTFDCAGCLECGTCRVVCPQSLQWEYPRGGFGIVYRYG
ncbi:MAG: 4Fe-4S dicluster domain-containing protein [Syntrophothermus sp.]|uniref:ferredoxin family protein n=1 Tax=Syntrophothermus sp. TaxID=2736299 RepID=UPI002580C093|nr:4Fe-4S dicluster domain-containing protein [Syntrophothermus sp.]NSW82222.1 4Fe-4S dicluster domain-containing protein [Syntrophothermus sp.]